MRSIFRCCSVRGSACCCSRVAAGWRRYGPDRIYVLNAAPVVAAGVAVGSGAVGAAAGDAAGLDTDRIALVRPGNELDYYAASRFGEPLPKVLRRWCCSPWAERMVLPPP